MARRRQLAARCRKGERRIGVEPQPLHQLLLELLSRQCRLPPGLGNQQCFGAAHQLNDKQHGHGHGHYRGNQHQGQLGPQAEMNPFHGRLTLGGGVSSSGSWDCRYFSTAADSSALALASCRALKYSFLSNTARPS